jgi:hypothetical protein
MIQYAGLMLRNGLPTPVLANMLPMASQKDCRVRIQETPALGVQRVEHSR